MLPGVAGRIDHLAVDPVHHRVFVAEIANGSVDVVDLDTGVSRRISHLPEPQGVVYLPMLDQIAVACGGDGTVSFYNAQSLGLIGRVKVGGDADNLRIMPGTGQLTVGYGAGAIAVIDPRTRAVIRTFALPAHPEGFQIDAEGGRIFVNLPNAGALAVIDLATGKAGTKVRTPHMLTFPMALDPRPGGSIAIVSRLPTHITLFDPESGTIRHDLATCGDADDVFLDAKRRRWYVSCGAGSVDVFTETAKGMARYGTVKTGPGARTSLFMADLDRLIVAMPARGHVHDARLLILRPRD